MGKLIVALVLCLAAPLAAQSTGLRVVAVDARGSVDSGEIVTAGGVSAVQVCGGTVNGDEFDGVIRVFQGMWPGRLAETYNSGPIVGMLGCGAAGVVPLPLETRITRVVVTLERGRQSTWLYWSRRAVQGEGSK